RCFYGQYEPDHADVSAQAHEFIIQPPQAIRDDGRGSADHQYWEERSAQQQRQSSPSHRRSARALHCERILASWAWKNEAQVDNGMVTVCLENKSTWTLADMRTAGQSAKERWYSGERNTPRMADAVGLDEEGRIRKAHAKTGCVYARNP